MARLTLAEINILLDCGNFVEAGEISGSPLEADVDEHPNFLPDDPENPTVARKCKALNSALNKLASMSNAREDAAARRKARKGR